MPEYAKDFVPKSLSYVLPSPLTDLFDPKTLKFNHKKLLKKYESRFDTLEVNIMKTI